jgi:hypothetical protein
MKPKSHPPSLSCSGRPLPGLRASGTGGSHFKPFAVALALGAGIVAGSAQAQTILDVGGVGVIADETLPAAGNLPVGGTNWSVVGNIGGVKYSGLVSPAATVGASGPVILRFNHRYNFEATGDPWDGGAVFVSVNGGAFTYVPSASFSANPYVGPTTANAGSTWASGGEDVFYGESAGYATPSLIASVANLGTLTAGDTVRVEFRGGWDAAQLNGPPAWEIGTVKLTDAATTDILNADFTANGKSGFTVANIGTVTAPWTYLEPVSRFEIDATAVTSDRYAPVVPASVINLNGASIQVAILSGTLAPGQVYTLFDLSGGTTLTGALGSISLPSGTWDTTNLSTNGTITYVAPVIPACQLGVLSLAANGGINPNTGVAWKVGDKYRLAFHTNGNTVTTSNNPDFYNDFSTTEAWTVPALQGTYWKAMITVNLDPTPTQALSPKREAKVNTGTGNLTGGSAQGGAGEPVYVVNGTTCIARNNADIWDAWSNPFENSLGVPNALGTGSNTQRFTGGFYSPYLNQNGAQTVTPNAVHGKDVATGCDSAGNHVNALGDTTDAVDNISRGSSNANNTGRVWNRFTDTTVTPRSLYVISVPLTIVDTNETIDPTLISFVDDRAGADFTLGTGSLVYTVTFSEPMDASTLTIADFDNAGTATVTIDKIRGTLNPAAFEVTVTPITAGIEDPVGNPLDTTAPIPDDTTINVVIDTTPPSLASITDNVAGGEVVAFNGVTYTVTFDEPMSSATVDIADFGNGGTAPIIVNSVAPTGNPAVYTVSATPTGAGSLTLEIVSGATITDLIGNPLVTTSALPDDTTITVTPDPLPTLVSIVDNQAGGPVFATQSFTYFVTFNQVINSSSVDVSDFENSAAPAVTVNAVARTSNPSVFAVHVTPGGAGAVTLQIAAGAVITNANGTALDSTTALADDTTITVNAGSGPGRGTITINGTATWFANSVTLSGTLNASGSSKLVVIVTGEHGNPGDLSGNSNTVTYDGVALTKVIDRNPIGGTPVDQTFNDIWYLDNPGAVHVAGAIVAGVNSRGNVTAFALSGTAPGVGQTAVSPQASKSVVLSTGFANSIVIASHGMGGDGNTANVTAVNATLPLIERTATAQTSLWDGHVTATALVPAPATATYAFNGGNTTGSHTIAAEFLAGEAVGYFLWAATNGAGVNLDADHDNDGVKNGIEYFLGGPTGNTTGFTPLPGVIDTLGTLSVTWPKGSGYLGVYGTDYVVETSSTLTGVWTTETLLGGNVDDSSGTEVKYTFPGPLSGKNFVRLKVTGP